MDDGQMYLLCQETCIDYCITVEFNLIEDFSVSSN